ncbi:MAG: hypothetical protein ACOCUH_01220 [Bacteriovoracia bacterium]
MVFQKVTHSLGKKLIFEKLNISIHYAISFNAIDRGVDEDVKDLIDVQNILTNRCSINQA